MVAIPLADYLSNELYWKHTHPTGHMNFWPVNWNPGDDRKSFLNKADADKDYCMSPSKYEYCDTEECLWKAQDIKCVDLCTSENFQDCVENTERWFKDGRKSGGIFFPTFFTDYTTTYLPGSGADAGKIIDRRVEARSRIMKGIEDMIIGFDHGYVHENPSERSTNRKHDEKYDQGLLTITRNENKEEIERFQPGQPVELSLKMLLEQANIALDSITAELGANRLSGAQIREGILPRLAGAVITLEITYENPSRHKLDWNGPVAYVTIYGSHAWTSSPVLQILDPHGSQRMRYFQGVQVEFLQHGTFNRFDFHGCCELLASIIVFYGMGTTLIAKFCCRCLGGLSSIYRGFCYQPVHIASECRSMAARLASYTSTFLELEDVNEPGCDSGGISRERLLHRFIRVFGTTKMTEMQVYRFVNFVFDGMNKHREPKDGQKESQDILDIEEWLQACVSIEPLNYEPLLYLFDSNRKKGFLERCFAPKTMDAIWETDALVRSDEDRDLFAKLTLQYKALNRQSTHKVQEMKTHIKQAENILSHLDRKDNFYARMKSIEQKIRLEWKDLQKIDSRVGSKDPQISEEESIKNILQEESRRSDFPESTLRKESTLGKERAPITAHQLERRVIEVERRGDELESRRGGEMRQVIRIPNNAERSGTFQACRCVEVVRNESA